MAQWNRPGGNSDLLERVAQAEKAQKKKGTIWEYDPDDRPGAIAGVNLLIRLREYRTEPTYHASVTWNPIAPGTCAADIDFYVIEIEPTGAGGVPKENGRKKREYFFVKHSDDVEADVLKVVFEGDLEHPKSWYWRARVRVVDTDGRKGVWSAWTAPQLPFADANPKPPVPANLFIDFDKGEKGRDDARYRMILRCDEIGPWDIPPSDHNDPNRDQQDKQDDVRSYQFEARRCTAAGVFITKSNGEYIHKRKTVPSKPEEEDANNKVRCEFGSIRKRYYWKARVRSIDRYSRHGDWSAWTIVGTPLDNDRPPVPKNPLTDLPGFILDPDADRIELKWASPVDPDDTDPDIKDPDPDISHAQIQGSDRADFNKSLSTYWVEDPMCKKHSATFKRKKHPGPFYFRIRNVDGSGLKGNFVTESANKVVPPAPTNAPNITFSKGGKKGLRATLAVAYPGGPGYNEDYIRKFEFQFQNEDSNPNDSDDKHHQTVRIAEGEDNLSHKAIFEKIKKGEKCRARYRVEDGRDHQSAFGPWSTIVTAGGGKKPGKVSAKTLRTKPRGVEVRISPPTTWSDGTTDGFSTEEVARYKMILRDNNGSEVDRDEQVLELRKFFPFTKAEMASLALPLRVEVFAIGWDGEDDGADGITSSASPGSLELDPDSVGYDQIGSDLGANRYGYYPNVFIPANSSQGTRSYISSGGPSGQSGDLLFNTYDGKLYKYESGWWYRQVESGTDIIAGTIIADQITSGIFTGPLFRTQAAGQRVELGGTHSNLIAFYNSANAQTGQIYGYSEFVYSAGVWSLRNSLHMYSPGSVVLQGVTGISVKGTLDVEGTLWMNANPLRMENGDIRGANFIELNEDPSYTPAGGKLILYKRMGSNRVVVKYPNGNRHELAQDAAF